MGVFTQLDQISLKDILNVIENSLRDRIRNIEETQKLPVKNIDINKLIRDLLNNIIIGQALIAMANV
ncbi:MAG: hypothetical protein JW891_05740 [Candidatus Lokiarchaeota archaeon]|nr:hypothetical protein [Candidatus Lokiarchaeota archaeon]